MSANYYDEFSADAAVKKQTTGACGEAARGRIEKGVNRLLVIAAVIFAAQLIWLFGISPFIPFSNVEIHGFSGLSRAEILSIAGIDENTSFISANTREMRERLSANVLVESAVVRKRFPDRLSIFLNPREAVAAALISVGSRQAPLYVDRHGVFFKAGETGSLDTQDIPIISGIENPAVNLRLPAALVSLTENLKQLSSSYPQLLSAISEIRIEEKMWDGYDLIIYPVHSSIRVRIENNLTEETIRYMLLMLNVFENEPYPAGAQKPQEIDFRSAIASYKIKETF